MYNYKCRDRTRETRRAKERELRVTWRGGGGGLTKAANCVMDFLLFKSTRTVAIKLEEHFLHVRT